MGDGAGSVGDGGSEGGAAATEAAADGGRVEAAEAADDADRDLATVAATHIVAEGVGDQVMSPRPSFTFTVLQLYFTARLRTPMDNRQGGVNVTVTQTA